MKKISISILLIMTVLLSVFALSASAEPSSIVILNRDSINLYPNQTYKLILSDPDVSASFSTSNANAASVDSSGNVTAVSEGTAIITAKLSNGHSSQCTVYVKNGISPQDIVLNTQSINLTVDSTYSLSAAVYPDNVLDKSIYYSSSDNSVATVNEVGYIRAVGTGVAVISAESSSSAVVKKCIVKVNSTAGIGNFSVLLSGTVYSLSGKLQKNNVIEIKSSKTAQRTITDENGKFRFENVPEGNYVMSLYKDKNSKNSYAATQLSVGSYNMGVSCIVNKNEIVLLYQDQYNTANIQDITLGKSSIILDAGEDYDMSFIVRPSNIGTPALKCSSSNESVATVDSDGKITAVSKGNAQIVFSTVDGKISKSCAVTVTDLNSNKYSWLIILIETIIILAVSLIFIYKYKKFLRQKEKEEMGKE